MMLLESLKKIVPHVFWTKTKRFLRILQFSLQGKIRPTWMIPGHTLCCRACQLFSWLGYTSWMDSSSNRIFARDRKARWFEVIRRCRWWQIPVPGRDVRRTHGKRRHVTRRSVACLWNVLACVTMLVKAVPWCEHGGLVIWLQGMCEESRRRGASVRVQRKWLAICIVAVHHLSAAWLQAVLPARPISVVRMIDLVLSPQANRFFDERLFHIVRQLFPLLAQNLTNLCVAHFWVVPVHLSPSFFGPDHERV